MMMTMATMTMVRICVYTTYTTAVIFMHILIRTRIQRSYCIIYNDDRSNNMCHQFSQRIWLSHYQNVCTVVIVAINQLSKPRHHLVYIHPLIFTYSKLAIFNNNVIFQTIFLKVPCWIWMVILHFPVGKSTINRESILTIRTLTYLTLQ